jgi:mono/diheme cytochrome c family protein
MKRIVLMALAVVILGVLSVAGLEVTRAVATEQSSLPVADLAGQVRHGAYLARVGNCMACHTARGGKEYAGGRALATPFGNIHTPNLTPDTLTGIGAWTPDDFWRAIHNGRSKDGSFLYPAFPYPNYTKMSRSDSDALYAYFRTLAPVTQPNRGDELSFPYNQRLLLPIWRALNFRQGEYQAQASRGVEWNRGAYLVQGLGHCSACHAGRNALGGSIAEQGLGGGIIPMQNWYASSLASDAGTGLGEWDVADIGALLQTGVSTRGTAVGPMAEVVSESLQHVSGADIHAMAVYLKSLPGSDVRTPGVSVRAAGDAGAILRQGAKVYEQNCAECHGADGEGISAAYPRLAGNRAATADTPVNLVRMILNGGYPPSTHGNPRPYGMPPFGPSLSDAEVAAVASYVRASWHNRVGLVSTVDVSRLRGVPAV